MAAESRPAPYNGPWTRRARDIDEWMGHHKVVFSATAASLVSTFAGFPLDSLKSRLQSSRESTSIARLAAEVIREEGIGGLWRGFPLPLITISIVRTISFTIYTSTKRILNSVPDRELPRYHPTANGLASSSGTNKGRGLEQERDAESGSASTKPMLDIRLGLFTQETAGNVAITSLLAGGASGAVVCIGSAPFELVKVRRQLEYQIYRDSHPQHFAPTPPSVSTPPPYNHSLTHHPSGTSADVPHHTAPTHTPSTSPAASTSRTKASSIAAKLRLRSSPPPFVPPTTLQAVKMIIKTSGYRGLYTGWRLHFIRDTMGTALYFAEYDVMRHLLGRKRDGTSSREGDGLAQGDVPEWARSWLPKGVIPFLCGSVAGVTSWALIYPVDAIKTKAQQRALSGLEPRTPLTQLTRLVRGTDANNPKPLLMGITRLYRGLGISMIRSMLTHGLLWTIVDAAGNWIDTRPLERWVGAEELAP